MGDLTIGYTFSNGATVTPTKLNDAVNLATINAGALSADSTGRAMMADGYLSADATGRAKIADGFVTAEKIAAGVLGQTVEATLSAYSTAGTTNQFSTSGVPTSSGGTLLMSQAITPTSSSNKVRVEFRCSATSNAGLVTMVFALFRGTTCINADIFANPGAGYMTAITLGIVDSPASSSEQTYSVRYSGTGGYNIYINGYGSQHIGGASKATLTLTEIKA